MSARPFAVRAHAFASRRVILPLYDASLGLRATTRGPRAAYVEGMRFRRAAAAWPAERRLAWQLGRLRALVRRAAATTPHYRDLFRREGFDPAADFDFADYARLPVLERDAVRAAGDALLSTALPRASLKRDATGGSTGTPTVVWRGPDDDGWSRSGSEYYLERVAGPHGGGTAFLWGHHLDPVAHVSWTKRLRDWAEHIRWYDCFRLSPDVLLAYHRDMQRRRPARLVAYAGALAALAEAVEASGDAPRYPARACVTGAEKLYPHQRALVRRVFGVPVYERYGSRDVGLMAFQQDPASTDFTVDWANVLLEPDGDATGDRAAGDDTAGLLVTKLHGDGMPLLRYRVGDVARFAAGARPGAPAHVLREVVGRDLDRIVLPSGRWVHAISFPHLMKDFPVRDFQVRQARDLSVEVHVVPTAAFDGTAHDAILHTVRANLAGVPVAVRVVEDIARTAANKWRPVVSEAASAPPAPARPELAGVEPR